MSGLTVPAAAATGSGLPLQEYVNDGAGGHLWNAYDQTQDALGPDVTGRPSAITYGATVQVFVQSDTGDLMSWVNDDQGGHLWNAYDLSSLAGSGAPIYANPDAVVNGATVDVFAESDAGDLVEYANDGVGGRLWNAYDLSSLAAGGGPVQGDASAFFEGGVPYVFVRASNGDLTEYADSASGANPWTATDLSTLAAGGGLVTGDPSALDQSGTFDVFVRSPSGSLTQYVDVAGTWSTDELTTSANGGTSVESNPAAIVYGSTIHVYVTSSTGDLTEYANGGSDSSTWTAYDLSELAGGGAPVQSDPTPLLYGPTVHVYVESTASHLIEYVNDGAGGRLWNAYDLSDDAGEGGPIGTDPAAVLYGGTVVHVYAGGTNTCPANVANQLANTGSATQLITVDAPSYSSTTATLTAWQLEGGCWQTVFGPSTARVGTAGVSDHKQEGDGTTPTGAYSIGSTMYGVDPNPGVSYAYHQLVCGDWWDEDPSTPDYNTFQHVACGTNPPFGGDSEALWTTVPAYDYFAVIDYNDNPIVSGAGSAIFLHVDTGSPTAGCVSIPVSELTAVLDWLSPAANPLIVIGTDAEIRYF
jgi:L,D-peptidoglycan transpeptidase YkuD (ErfK/YbiS/YcfS/YnhG family)/NADPH-dependent 7-cyano-7-deazaguanine reductase QueF-like protein